jgi:hypothetical protein
MEKWKDIPKDMSIFCIVVEKWKMVVLGKQHNFYGILS